MQPRFLRKPRRRPRDPSDNSLKVACKLGSCPTEESDAESSDVGDDVNDVSVVLPPEQLQEDESLRQEMEMDRLLWTRSVGQFENPRHVSANFGQQIENLPRRWLRRYLPAVLYV